MSQPSNEPHPTIALLGAPNSGKSALFNMLTGLRQKVGNYAGVTVEKKSAQIKLGSESAELIDLPGTYSLVARSQDEAVATQVLLGSMSGTPLPDALVIVVDASALERSLALASQILDFETPTLIVLTMLDVAKRRGLSVDIEKLSSRLGVPVLPSNPAKGEGKAAICEALAMLLAMGKSEATLATKGALFDAANGLRETLAGIAKASGQEGVSLALAMRTLCDSGELDPVIIERFGGSALPYIEEARERYRSDRGAPALEEAKARQAWARELVSVCADQSVGSGKSTSAKLDRLLTHRVWGLAIFLLLMALVFQAIYAWSGPFMDMIEALFGFLGDNTAGRMDEGPLKSLINAVVVDGVGGVLVFLPQIVMLFLFLAIMEESGYMSRAAMLMDRLLRPFGLNGRSFIPMLSGFACAIPAIMATRSISDRAARLTTIMIVPLTSCSARLPVYALMIGLFIPETPIFPGFDLRGAVLLIMYMLGVVVAIPVALVFRKWIFKGKASSFMIDLPSYKAPRLKSLGSLVLERSKLFVVNAGTIIFAMAIVIWALAYFPHSDAIAKKYEAEHATLTMNADDAGEAYDTLLESEFSAEELENEEFEAKVEDFAPAQQSDFTRLSALVEAHGDIDSRESAEYMETSILGTIGKSLEPVFVPLGWDWRISTAVIASFPAREVVIGVMGTIFSQGDDSDEESQGLHDALTSAKWPDGRPLFTLATALSLMVFFALCMQCGASVAAIKREMNSWKWATISFFYMTILAYVLALITFQVTDALI